MRDKLLYAQKAKPCFPAKIEWETPFHMKGLTLQDARKILNAHDELFKVSHKETLAVLFF